MRRTNTGSGWAQVLGLVASVLLTATTALATDVWDQASTPDDSAANTRNVLIPGDPPQRHDVQTKAGPTADQDWYRLVVVQGHSYEVRVGARQSACFDFGAAPGGNANFQVMQSNGTTLITTGTDFPGTGAISSFRATFVAPTSENAFVGLVGLPAAGPPSCGADSEYTIEAFDTTLVSPFFSTFSGFETFYRILNTSSVAISGTLTLFDASGNVLVTTNVDIPAGGSSPTIFTGPTAQGGLNVADDKAGPARFTHNGPPGGILIDGFLGNFSVNPPVVLPIKFVRPE